MIPKVSVLYPTWRLGGFDCLRAGLARSTMPATDFEVIIVDALFPYREEALLAYFKDSPYRVVIVPPEHNTFPQDAGNHARNTAIKHARGDVLVWVCDFSILDSLALERHYDNLVRAQGRSVSHGTHVYGTIDAPAIHPDYLAALPFDSIDEYVDLIERLPADSPLWTSIFAGDPLELGRKANIRAQHGIARPWGQSPDVVFGNAVALGPWAGHDAKMYMLPGPINQHYVWAKNEAMARNAALAIGGWDETFDGSKAYEDIDFGNRLAMLGLSFIYDPGCYNFVPNPRPLTPIMRRSRGPEANRALMLERLGEVLKGDVRARRGLS